jgi:hypothetical protein
LLSDVVIAYLATIILTLVMIIASLLCSGPADRANHRSHVTKVSAHNFYAGCSFYAHKPRGSGDADDDDSSGDSDYPAGGTLPRGGGGGSDDDDDDYFRPPAAGGRAQLMQRARGRCASPPPTPSIMNAQPGDTDNMEVELFGETPPPVPCPHLRTHHRGSTRTTRRCTCYDCGVMVWHYRRHF